MKTKILYVLTRPPLPAVDGTRERIIQEINFLSNDFEIDLLIITNEKVPDDIIEKLKQKGANFVHIFKLRACLSYLNSFFAFFTNKPLQSQYFYSSKAYKWLSKNESNYQTIFFHTLRFGQYIKNLKKDKVNLSSRLLIGFNDAISLNYKDASKKAKGLWRIIYKIESKRIKEYELELLEIADSFSIVSSRDRDYILKNWQEIHHNLPSPEIKVIRSSLDDKLISNNYNPENDNLVFIGNLRYPPNRQGLEFFCKNFWPEIIKKIKGIKLIIIGRDGDKFFQHYPRVEALGFVDDPYKIMTEQAMFISPADFGAGVPSKTLLAMALGLPVISTHNNAMGIDGIIDNTNICLIDYTKPEESINKIVNAIKDKSYRTNVGREGKKLILEYYLQSKNYNLLKSFINGVNP